MRTQTFAALILTAIGFCFGTLPFDWLELRLGVHPDASSGILEFLFAAIPLVMGCISLGQSLARTRPPDRTGY